MKKDAKDYSVEELKAVAYDNMKQIQMFQANIQAVENELARRNGSQPAPANDINKRVKVNA